MKKKRYEGMLQKVPEFEIFLNVNHLAKGKYQLKIVNKRRVIKSTHFTKE